MSLWITRASVSTPFVHLRALHVCRSGKNYECKGSTWKNTAAPGKLVTSISLSWEEIRHDKVSSGGMFALGKLLFRTSCVSCAKHGTLLHDFAGTHGSSRKFKRGDKTVAVHTPEKFRCSMYVVLKQSKHGSTYGGIAKYVMYRMGESKYLCSHSVRCFVRSKHSNLYYILVRAVEPYLICRQSVLD